VVGHPRRRVDGRAKVTGQTADDIFLPPLRRCRLLRRTHASCVDTTRAAQVDGQQLVLGRLVSIHAACCR
jgi:hypothetical protein